MTSRVLLKRDCLVRAEDSDPRPKQLGERTLLSASSHSIASIPYRNRILFFRKHSSNTLEEIVLQMKDALSITLAHFYTLPGRIYVREDHRMELLCNNAGIKFIEANCNMSLGEADKFDMEMELLEQFCQAPGHEHDLHWPWPSNAPLLFIQVTEFSCGGFCLGLKYNHQLMDGTSLWHFVKTWAEISCGKPVSVLPDIVPDPIEIPGPESLPPPLPANHRLHRRNEGFQIFPADGETPMVTKRFRFDKSQLEAFKTRHAGFTKFQLLSSHVWSHVTRARDLPDDETSNLIFPINSRERCSPLSKAYFGGGAVIPGVTAMSCGQLKSASLEQVASNIKQATDGFATLEHREIMCKVSAYYAGDPVNMCALEFSRGKDILIGSSFNFPVYEEFAWGKPFEMAMVQRPGDGWMYYFPGRERGSVDLYMTLSKKVMERLVDFEKI